MNRPSPNACYCRMCQMARWRAANRYRRKTGKPDLPKPQMESIQGQGKETGGCPCNVCEANRRAQKRTIAEDADLDRKALQKWPDEWGIRA